MAEDSVPQASEVERLRRERDLYRDLLDLGRRDDIEPLLEGALDLVVRLAGARRGYIELFEDRDEEDAPRFLVARGCYDEDVDEIRAALSQGIMAEAIATGRTITLESAQLDPRVRKRRSVQRNRTEAVLCAPIGASPPIGVVYLQDRDGPGPFTEDDRRIVEDLARHLAVLANRLLACERCFEGADPTRPFRGKLHRGAAGIVGRSRALARVLERISHVAPRRNIGVLLGGPSGTGKTELARLLHDSSPRAGAPFVALNCASLSQEHVELHLFGVEKRTFTEVDERPGKIEAAEGGTLFLDEIADLPLASQAKLLTFLDHTEYTRIGSTRTRKADVRVVAATNADLPRLVESKAFRADLYYRLCVVQVPVPALDERPEDVPLLAEHLCGRVAAEESVPRLPLSTSAHRALAGARWPGNIRQLYKCIQAAMVYAAGEQASAIEPRHLFPDEGEDASPEPLTMQDAARRLKKHQVERALDEAGGNVKKAAELLGVSRSHIYNLITSFGIERKKD